MRDHATEIPMNPNKCQRCSLCWYHKEMINKMFEKLKLDEEDDIE